MLLKSYDLKGIALDWAVAKSETLNADYNMVKTHQDNRGNWHVMLDGHRGCYEPSVDAHQANYLQEELKISVFYVEDDDPLPIEDGPWSAAIPNSEYGYTGPTSLIAVCRCYVANKLGEDIEIPDNLLKD